MNVHMYGHQGLETVMKVERFYEVERPVNSPRIDILQKRLRERPICTPLYPHRCTCVFMSDMVVKLA